MKKFFTLCFLMAALAVSAQDYYVFTDKDGNTIENNDTITCTEVEDDGMGSILINSGLSVKNVAAPSNYQVGIKMEITRIDNGALQLCFPINCNSYTTIGTYGDKGDNKDKEKATLAEGESKNIMTEWFPLAYGECIAEYTATAYQSVFPKGTYKVTVHYKYSDPSGIKTVSGAKTQQQCFDLQGRRQQSVRRGLNIVRNSDGSIYKFFSK